MFFLSLSHNCHGIRCPVRKSCPYKAIAKCSEVYLHSQGLHSYLLHRDQQYLAKVEHLMHSPMGCYKAYIIKGALRFLQIPFMGRCVAPYHYICDAIDPFAFRTEVPLSLQHIIPRRLRSICKSWAFAGVGKSFSMILTPFTSVCAFYPK